MDMETILTHLSRWLHILPAIVLVGGTIFINVILQPALDTHEAEDNVKSQIKRKWSKVIMLCAMLLLISGFYNTYRAMTGDEKPGGFYHGLLGLKLVLVFGIFYISSLLAGKSEPAQKFQQKEVFWGKVNMIAAITVVVLAGAMKLTDRNPKIATDPVSMHTVEPTSVMVARLPQLPTPPNGDITDG